LRTWGNVGKTANIALQINSVGGFLSRLHLPWCNLGPTCVVFTWSIYKRRIWRESVKQMRIVSNLNFKVRR